VSETLLVLSKLHFRDRMQKISEWFEKPLAVPISLFVIALACYGLLINRLGYYWDDFPLTYIGNIYGSEGLTRYFSTNRPFWGLLYQITFRMFNQPWQWQVNALFWRWLSAVILWLLLREIWPKPKYIAIWVSMVFLVYPGFTQQHISVIYSNLLIILDCFLLSLYFNIKAVRHSGGSWPSRKGWIWHLIALLLSLYNLLALEYFFALDLLRPLLIWNALGEENYNRNKRLKVTLVNWLPYLVLWVLVTVWRVFFFSFQTHNYQMLFFKSLQNSPINAITSLIKDIGTSLWVVLVSAWAQVFRPPNITQLGLRTTIATIVIIIIVAGLSIWYLWQNRKDPLGQGGRWSIIFTGLVACILGGVPWWLTELPPSLRFPSDRFTLPFILGVSLIIVGLLGVLPIKTWIKSVILGILIGFAVGSQFQVVNLFRRDWETQRRFFWQLAWRIPGLDHGTTLMVNDLPVTYYSDNSLTAPLNWFWAPNNTTLEMAYLLLYPSQRLGKSLASLKPDTPLKVDYLAANFYGNTSRVVSVFYDPPACLRVLDRELDSDNRMLSLDMQAAAALSSTQWIHPEGKVAEDILPKNLYTPEPPHGWCYYFELADLARQQENWEEVAHFGDIAYNLNDYPNDPTEHFPFIEGYAHTGNWVRAHELSEQSQSVTPLMVPLLCRLWQRIDLSTPDRQEKEITIDSIYSQLGCSP
jgi:hypothetical protein